MDEILWELREHAAGLNAGRWDYLFSSIKKLRSRDLELPDRAQLTMTVPFMRAYTELLVQTCHKRGAHAIGGMAAFIPSRRDAELNATALARVREDKDRESGDGFDGTWVAHPDLVLVATEVFDRVLGDRPHQKERLRDEVVADAAALADVRVPGGTVTEAGVRNAVSVALQYLDSWLQGNGAAAINNLMEDAATAEISRALLWVWRRGGTPVAGGGGARGSAPDEPFSAQMYLRMRDEELAALGGPEVGRLRDAAGILDSLVTSDDFVDFLTLPAYGYLR
jgi:malate synthase